MEVIHMKCHKYLVGIVVFMFVVAAAIVSDAKGKPAQSSSVRAKFRNSASDGIKSDGQFANLAEAGQSCGDVDYVDKTDACTITNAAKASTSSIAGGSLYELRPIPECCTNQSNPDLPWGPYELSPSRYIVLDFSSGSGCLNIDQQIHDDASTNGSGATTPLNTDSTTAQCVDFLEVRFEAAQAFSRGASSTSLKLIIDEPQLILAKHGSSSTQWDAIYTLQFASALPIIHNSDGSVTLTAAGSNATASLLDPNNNVVGTYSMPFSVTLKRPWGQRRRSCFESTGLEKVSEGGGIILHADDKPEAQTNKRPTAHGFLHGHKHVKESRRILFRFKTVWIRWQ
jgi:hypothetical protein